MKRYVFNILFGNEHLIYDPLKNIILLPKKKKLVRLPGNDHSLFPAQTDIEKLINAKYYNPNILSLFQGLDCNLDCKYCFTPYKQSNLEIPENVVIAAAELVSKNAAKRKLPFLVGFRGGNEPLLNYERVKRNLDLCKSIAKKK